MLELVISARLDKCNNITYERRTYNGFYDLLEMFMYYLCLYAYESSMWAMMIIFTYQKSFFPCFYNAFPENTVIEGVS